MYLRRHADAQPPPLFLFPFVPREEAQRYLQKFPGSGAPSANKASLLIIVDSLRSPNQCRALGRRESAGELIMHCPDVISAIIAVYSHSNTHRCAVDSRVPVLKSRTSAQHAAVALSQASAQASRGNRNVNGNKE